VFNHVVVTTVYGIFCCASGECIHCIRPILDLPCLGIFINERLAMLSSYSCIFLWDAMVVVPLILWFSFHLFIFFNFIFILNFKIFTVLLHYDANKDD